MRSTLSVEQACANWLAGRHGLRKSAKAAYRNGLQPLRDRCGEMPIQAPKSDISMNSSRT